MEGVRELLEAAAARDPEAVAEVVRRFSPSAQRLAQCLLRDAALAEDAVQDAFVVAFERLSDLREPECFPAWLRQIVRTAANRIDRRRRRAALPEGAEPQDDGSLPPEEAANSELRAAVRAAVARLPPAARESVELFYFHERSVAEVARWLDVPPGTVRRRLHDARARLAALWIGNPAGLDIDKEHGT
jgi:RNA polymerase sigma factor (sigma-70 family)